MSNAGQDAIGPLGHLGTRSAHVQPSVNQHPQVPLFFTVIQPLCPKPIALHGVIVAKVQGPSLGLVEPHPIQILSQRFCFVSVFAALDQNCELNI